MGDDDLRRQLDALTARIERIEQRLGMSEAQPQAPADMRSDAARSEPSAPPSSTPTPPTAPPPQPIAEHAAPRTPSPGEKSHRFTASRTSGAPSKRSITPFPFKESSADQSRQRRESLEVIIGRYWFAWVGAIVVVIAVGLFFKLAYDQGWLGMMSPFMRCALAALFGGLLLACGEVAHRKINRHAAAGLHSAGIAVLYLTVYAALRLELVTQTGGLGLLTAVAVLGFVVTWRAEHLAIGVVSVAGGYFSPLLLGQASAFPGALPFYLTMLHGVSLGLSAVHHERFRTLRYVSMGGLGLLGFIWLFDASGTWQITLPFITLWWAMVAAEALRAANRNRSAIGNAVASLLATAWFVTAGVWVLNQYIPNGEAWLGVFTIAVAALAGAGAAQFGPGIDGLRRAPVSAIDKLAMALWAQCGVLIAVAVALQFDGYGQSVSWLVFGLACVEVGRRLPSRGVSHFGVIVGALALLRVAAIDWQSTILQQTVLEVGPLTITKYALLVLLAIAATQAAALRLPRAGDERATILGTIICVIGMIFWAGFCAMIAEDIHVTIGWLIGTAMLLAFERIGRRQHYAAIAVIVLAFSCAKWLTLDVSLERLVRTWDATAHWPAINLQFFAALAAAALGWWSARLFSRGANTSLDVHGVQNRRALTRFSQVLIGGAGLFLIVAMCFEVDRAVGWYVSMREAVIWHPRVLRVMWLSLLVGVSGMGWHVVAQRAGWNMVRPLASVVCMAGAITWLTAGTLVPRFDLGVVDTTVVFNVQFEIGAAMILTLAVLARLAYRSSGTSTTLRAEDLTSLAALTLAGLIGLWMGSLEIDRALAGDPGVTQAGLSVYWALYGASAVVIGFIKRSAAARWTGLGLVAVTVAKVLIIDMAGVDPLYRVISTVIVGLLLIAVSVGYAKITPRLVGE